MTNLEKFEEKQAEMSDKELLEKTQKRLSKLCATGGKSLTMSVPPSVDNFDMLVCELMRRYKNAIIPPEQQILTTKLYTKEELFDMLNNVLATVNIRCFGENVWNEFVKNDNYGKTYCVIHDVSVEDTAFIEDGRYSTILIPEEDCKLAPFPYSPIPNP